MAIYGRSGTVFNSINVTPLTDVFLVLLVIMILIVPLTKDRCVLKIDPPGRGCPVVPNTDQKYLTIEIAVDGTVKFNGQKLDPADSFSIEEKIRAEQKKAGKKDLPLCLVSNPMAKQKQVVAVMDAAAGAGVPNLKVELSTAEMVPNTSSK